MNQARTTTVPSHDEVEGAITAVPGVDAATVSRSPDSGRSRLRIRLAPGEDPEAVAWAVAATLRERFGIALDPAEIKPRPHDDVETCPRPQPVDDPVRLVDPHPGAALAETHTPGDSRGAVARTGGERDVVAEQDVHTDRGGSARVRIDDLVADRGDDGVLIVATLALGGRLTRGEAATAPTTNGVLRAVAEATLEALRALLATPLVATVDRVSVQPGTEPGVAIVVMSLLTDRGEETLLGSSIVRGDGERAVMRATLDGLNRRIATLLDGPDQPM